MKDLGVSGIMRVKNDAEFIEASVESCISALDELIIVFNDCSDNSPEIIENVRQKYPDKIKTYEYEYKVYSTNLTKEEYEYAKSLPLDSPHLLCNYYNFALSKVTYQYAMKIDADQIYFTHKLKYWCDVYRSRPLDFNYKSFVGFFIWAYSRIVNKISQNSKKLCQLFPKFDSLKVYEFYSAYVAYVVSRTHRPVSLSGVDVYKDDSWYVTLGLKNEIINILPPYNGVGDHLIFKVGPDTYYRRDDCEFYNSLRSDNYSLIERFVYNQGNIFNIGTCWYHINSLRNNVKSRVKLAKDKYPYAFIPIDDFVKMNFNSEVYPLIDKSMMVHFQSSIFQFAHQMTSLEIINNLENLSQYDKKD